MYFITVNSDVPLTYTATEFYNCILSSIVEVLSQNFPYMVHLHVLSEHVRRHHMAELLTHLWNCYHQILTTRSQPSGVNWYFRH